MAKAKYEEWILEEGLLKIQGWARDGLTEEQIAHNMGIAVSTLGNWKKSHLEILEALKKGKEVVDIQVENALLKRALGYEFIEVTKERMSSEAQKKRHDGQSELTFCKIIACWLTNLNLRIIVIEDIITDLKHYSEVFTK